MIIIRIAMYNGNEGAEVMRMRGRGKSNAYGLLRGRVQPYPLDSASLMSAVFLSSRIPLVSVTCWLLRRSRIHRPSAATSPPLCPRSSPDSRRASSRASPFLPLSPSSLLLLLFFLSCSSSLPLPPPAPHLHHIVFFFSYVFYGPHGNMLSGALMLADLIPQYYRNSRMVYFTPLLSFVGPLSELLRSP